MSARQGCIGMIRDCRRCNSGVRLDWAELRMGYLKGMEDQQGLRKKEVRSDK